MSSPLPTGFLAIPEPGSAGSKSLRRKLKLLLLHRLLNHPGADLPEGFRQLQTALPALVRAYPDAVLSACANLDFRVCNLACRYEQALPPFLLALARRLPTGALEESILWDRPIARLADFEGGRVLEFDPPAMGMILNASGAELRDANGQFVDLLEQATAAQERPFRPILADRPAGPHLAMVDTNPLSMLEDHPDKSGNSVDLGDRDPEQWCDVLAQALGVIAETLPGLHQELLESVERVVPVGYEPERHLSASYFEAPGLVYLSLHPSVLTMAEALVHESQHGQLNLLRWFDAVLHNGLSHWAASPVRPDLRPLHGVLMAVHAFVPVSAMHLQLAESGHPLSQGPTFERRRAEVLGANAAGLETLRRHADPTPLGQRVLDALFELHASVSESAGEIDTNVGIEALG